MQEAIDLRAALSADLAATAARRQEVEAEVNDANRRATAARKAYENCKAGGPKEPEQDGPEQDGPEETEPAPDDTGAGEESVSG